MTARKPRQGQLFIRWVKAMMEALDEHRPFSHIDIKLQLKLDL